MYSPKVIQRTATAPASSKPAAQTSRNGPAFTIENDEAAAAARTLVAKRIEDLSFSVEGNLVDFTKQRMNSADAAAYVRDCEMLEVAQRAAKELSEATPTLHISAQTLEFLRCEIPRIDYPDRDGFAPHLPDLEGLYFTFDRPMGTDKNALRVDRLESVPHKISIPERLGVLAGSRDEIHQARAAVLDDLCSGYKEGVPFSGLLHGLERLLDCDRRTKLSLSGFSPFVILKSELSKPKAFSALKLKISEAFDVSNHRIIGGVEVRIRDGTTGSTRFLDRSIPQELELDRLCSRGLIEEIGHAVQGGRLPAIGLDEIAIRAAMLSSLTIRFLDESASGIAMMEALKADRPSQDILDEELRNQVELTQLVEIDVLAFFIERWRALSLPLTDLKPEIEQFHRELRRPFVNWCRNEGILPKRL